MSQRTRKATRRRKLGGGATAHPPPACLPRHPSPSASSSQPRNQNMPPAHLLPPPRTTPPPTWGDGIRTGDGWRVWDPRGSLAPRSHAGVGGDDYRHPCDDSTERVFNFNSPKQHPPYRNRKLHWGACGLKRKGGTAGCCYPSQHPPWWWWGGYPYASSSTSVNFGTTPGLLAPLTIVCKWTAFI